MLGIKKVIGQMGQVAKTGVQRAGNYVKEEAKEHITKDNIKQAGSTLKHHASNAVYEAGKVRDRAVDYSERVNSNTKNSALFDMGHERSESLLFGRGFERREHSSKSKRSSGMFSSASLFGEPKERHRKPKGNRGTTIVVHVNQGRSKRKKRHTHSNRSLLF